MSSTEEKPCCRSLKNENRVRTYREVSNISRTLVGNKIVDHLYVVSALLQLHLHSQINTWLQWSGQKQRQDETRNIMFLGLDASYIRELAVGFQKPAINIAR